MHCETSDGKAVDYHFQQDSGTQLLTEVKRSNKPDVHYQYQIIDNHALLLKKTLPEGRFVQVDYYTDKTNNHKVSKVTTPAGLNGKSTVRFSYGNHYTQVEGPGSGKTTYRFDDDFHLVAIEQYLDRSLYRVHRKLWGTQNDAGNLIATSVADAGGNVFYYKHYTYDSSGKGEYC